MPFIGPPVLPSLTSVGGITLTCNASFSDADAIVCANVLGVDVDDIYGNGDTLTADCI